MNAVIDRNCSAPDSKKITASNLNQRCSLKSSGKNSAFPLLKYISHRSPRSTLGVDEISKKKCKLPKNGSRSIILSGNWEGVRDFPFEDLRLRFSFEEPRSSKPLRRCFADMQTVQLVARFKSELADLRSVLLEDADVAAEAKIKIVEDTSTYLEAELALA
ncbi:hypothetical protein MKW98_015860, partial [Papaver atlanticum]